MLNFPKSTEFGKRIPKQKFYEQLDITPALKRNFVEQIRIINWKHKLAATTINVAEGAQVLEIEVFEIRLNDRNLDEAVLRQIDKEIPYHILFLLEYEEKYQAWIGYKEATESGKNAFKVNRYYHTDWLNEEEIPLKIDGLNMDTIYDNFVRQIAGGSLQSNKAESLKDSVERETHRLALQRQIDTLQAKVRKEKQLNKQMKLNTELKKLKKELEDL